MKIAAFLSQRNYDVIISSSLKLLLKYEFDIDVKIENHNHHDGQQLLFIKRTYQNTELKERCSCNLHIIARNEEF